MTATVVPVDHREIPPRPVGERPMDLLDLTQRPRALPILAAMSEKGRPFTERAFIAASGLKVKESALDLAEEMTTWGLIASTVHERQRLLSLTHGGRRVARLADEMQRALLDSPVRFHGDARVPLRYVGGP